MDRTQVSVIAAVYNGASTLARALDSVLGQRFEGSTEIIVVDDGSTDSTPEILRSYGDRVKVIRQPNGGLAAARNSGAAVARGELVAFVDADDVWMPYRLARTVAPLAADPQSVLAFSDLLPVTEDGKELASGYVRPEVARAPSMEDLLEQWWPILPSTVTIRRDVLAACGGFNTIFKSAAGFEDTYLWLLAREHGRFHYVAEPLVAYRLTPFVERMRKYAPGFGSFARLVGERYGAAGDAYIRRSGALYAQLLTMRAMSAIARHDTAGARCAMFCAMHYEPQHRSRALIRALAMILPRDAAMRLISLRRLRKGIPSDFEPGDPVPFDLL